MWYTQKLKNREEDRKTLWVKRHKLKFVPRACCPFPFTAGRTLLPHAVCVFVLYETLWLKERQSRSEERVFVWCTPFPVRQRGWPQHSQALGRPRVTCVLVGLPQTTQVRPESRAHVHLHSNWSLEKAPASRRGPAPRSSHGLHSATENIFFIPKSPH